MCAPAAQSAWQTAWTKCTWYMIGSGVALEETKNLNIQCREYPVSSFSAAILTSDLFRKQILNAQLHYKVMHFQISSSPALPPP